LVQRNTEEETRNLRIVPKQFLMYNGKCIEGYIHFTCKVTEVPVSDAGLPCDAGPADT
jgi:hypothetical protein